MNIAFVSVRVCMVALAIMLSACSTAPKLFEVDDIYVCAAEECGSAGQVASTSKLLSAMFNLMKHNEGRDFKMCTSDPKARNCQSESLSMMHIAMPMIPGRNSYHGGSVSKVRIEPGSQSVHWLNKFSASGTFGVPLTCSEHAATVTVRSATQITMTDEVSHCNWLGIGNVGVDFTFAVESVDFDRGQIGGYWSMGFAGTAVGRGDGYGIMQFSEPMPRGVNWLKD